MRYICFLLLFAAVGGCKYNNKAAFAKAHISQKINSASIAGAARSTFEDGTYCATIQYYNDETEANTNCNLLIEVRNNEMTRINSCDCNWLNESNFSPKKFDERGSITFKGSKGNEYIVTINENNPLRSKKFQCDICGKEAK